MAVSDGRSPQGRPPGRGERGAISTLFAVILVAGVFLGALALAVDVGQVVLERRLLQNGADAAALAAAQLCSEDRALCADQESLAVGIGAALRDEGLDEADITLCGPHQGVACPEPDLSDVRSCPPDSRGARNHVEVHLESTVATVFGAAAGGEPVASPRACARASWGPIAIPERTALPIAMAECAWRAATGGTPGGTGSPVYQTGPFGEAPGYGPLNPWPGGEITLAAAVDGAECSALSDAALAGGFVLLEAVDGCEADIRRGPGGQRWVEVADLGLLPCDDDDAFRHGEVVHIPIVDLTEASADRYEVLGMAAFYLAGWNFTDRTVDANAMPSLLTDVVPCVDPAQESESDEGAGEEAEPTDAAEEEEDTGAQDPQPVACMTGWFVHTIVPRALSDPSTTGDYGIIAIQLTG